MATFEDDELLVISNALFVAKKVYESDAEVNYAHADRSPDAGSKMVFRRLGDQFRKQADDCDRVGALVEELIGG